MEKTRTKMIIAWSLYQFAGSAYSINVISLYFALWVTIDMKGADIFYSLAFSSSVFLAALCSPLIGFLSDRIGKRMLFLIIFALGCFFGTALLGIVKKLSCGLLVFTFANFCYQSADIVSNMLIPQISKGKGVGQTAGYGTGFGYFGTIAGLLSVSPIVLHYGHKAAFIPTALLFLLFATPSFFIIKDSKYQIAAPRPKLIDIFLNPIRTLINIRQYPNLAFSLLAIFMTFSTIGTIIVFMSVYLKKVIGFLDVELSIYYIACSIFAILGGISTGFLVDKIGAKKVLKLALMSWFLSLFLAMLSPSKLPFWFIGPLVGLSLGTTWTSSRTLVVELAPKDKIGEFFGFYGLAIKTAAIFGPMLWGISVWSLGNLGIIKYRITIGIYLLLLIFGLTFLKKATLAYNKQI